MVDESWDNFWGTWVRWLSWLQLKANFFTHQVYSWFWIKVYVRLYLRKMLSQTNPATFFQDGWLEHLQRNWRFLTEKNTWDKNTAAGCEELNRALDEYILRPLLGSFWGRIVRWLMPCSPGHIWPGRCVSRAKSWMKLLAFMRRGGWIRRNVSCAPTDLGFFPYVNEFTLCINTMTTRQYTVWGYMHDRSGRFR